MEPCAASARAGRRDGRRRPAARRAALFAAALWTAGWAGDAALAAPPLPRARPAAEAALPLPLPRPSGLLARYRAAFDLARAGDWRGLARHRRAPAHPELEATLEWLRLADPRSGARFAEIAAFLAARPVWPERGELVRRAEEALDRRTGLEARLAWFERHPPRTAEGRVAWVAALKSAGRTAAWRAAARRVWETTPLPRAGQRRFLAEHAGALEAGAHWRRLDTFLWRGDAGAARAAMALVPADRRRLAEARLRLRAMAPGVDGAIRRVPAALRGDPGLLYERLRWRGRKGRHEEAAALFRRAPADPPRPALWWRQRAMQIREALDDGRIDDAARLAAGHVQRAGLPLANARWHAGWVALRFAGRPLEASRHFIDMHADVRSPISRARAAYWAGRALAAAGDRGGAGEWFALAARHDTTFYGQLAAARPEVRAAPPRPAGRPPPPGPAAFGDSGSRLLAATARALVRVGERELADRFLKRLVRGPVANAPAVAALGRELDRPDIGVAAARRAARSGLVMAEAGYPLVPLPRLAGPEPALVLAVARQESNFDAAARSPAGALGAMQLMPATAKRMARTEGARWSRDRLTADPGYNFRLGAAYLRRLLDRFDGDYVLAAAAYNAGPARARRWIAARGDPRDPEVDVVDWIERIPFHETRNYVQRVLENLHVYRRRLGAPAAGWRAPVRYSRR